MTNEEKAKELANLCVNCETIRNYHDCGVCDSPGIYKGALEMAAWKDEQLTEVCEKHCLSHIEQEGKRCAWLSIEGKHCWEI